jgi:hypothetical protein
MSDVGPQGNGAYLGRHAEYIMTACCRIGERVLRTFCNTDRPMASCVWRACLLGVLPVVAFELREPEIAGAIWEFVFSSRMVPMPWPWAIIVIVPWVEALLMWPVLWILKEIVQKELWVASIFAVIWSVLHALTMAPVLYRVELGLLIAWPSFVLSLCFLEWKKKSNARAIIVTALVLTCQFAAVGIETSLILDFVHTYGPYRIFE